MKTTHHMNVAEAEDWGNSERGRSLSCEIITFESQIQMSKLAKNELTLLKSSSKAPGSYTHTSTQMRSGSSVVFHTDSVCPPLLKFEKTQSSRWWDVNLGRESYKNKCEGKVLWSGIINEFRWFISTIVLKNNTENPTYCSASRHWRLVSVIR